MNAVWWHAGCAATVIDLVDPRDDLAACAARGIKVLSTPGVNALAVAELTLGFMSGLARRISIATHQLKQGRWIRNGGPECGTVAAHASPWMIRMFPTTIAGSLPKPAWLAEPDRLWAPWRLSGAELARAKRDATVLAVKLQEDAGVDIVTEGEQARQHFVHGFLERVDGIDFANKVEMGIRKDRYKAMVPQVTAPLRLRGRVHADEARAARAHTKAKAILTRSP